MSADLVHAVQETFYTDVGHASGGMAAEPQRFSRALVRSSPDCIIMEIDDFRSVAGADGEGFWPDDERESVRTALEQARSGAVGRFQGLCPQPRGR